MKGRRTASSGVVPAHRVIVIEDDDNERDKVEQLVRAAGFEVLGIDGACLEADSLSPELEASSAVLMNMSPADGTGASRVERLRDLHRDIRIVAYNSGTGDPSHGILAAIPMPLDPHALELALSVVTGMRAKPRMQASLRHGAVRAA